MPAPDGGDDFVWIGGYSAYVNQQAAAGVTKRKEHLLVGAARHYTVPTAPPVERRICGSSTRCSRPDEAAILIGGEFSRLTAIHLRLAFAGLGQVKESFELLNSLT